ncbi:MAG: MFS transporter [Actinobacteria bacterium]|nr:MFS transporter [Actinomycetota bacterium]
MGNKDNVLDYLKEMPNYLTVFIVPIYYMTISPMLIEMSKSTGITAGDLSLIVTFFTIGLITGQMTSVFFNKKFNKIKIILTGYILIFLLLIILFFNKNQFVFYMLYLLLGYISGVIWIQATKYILENNINNKDRLMTIFLSFFPIGNIIAPIIASLLINNNLNWRYYYFILISLVVIILILYITLKKGWRIKVEKEIEASIGIKKIFINKNINIVFIFGCLLLFFYSISETVMAAWSPTFLRTEKLFDINSASTAISIFWIAVLTGRIIISFIAGRIKTNYIILVLSVIAAIFMIFFIFSNNSSVVLITVGLAGLGHSGIITLGISSASTVYKLGRGILASIVFASINFGTSLAPFLTRYASGFSMRSSIIIAPFFMILAFLVVIFKILYENKNLKNEFAQPGLL